MNAARLLGAASAPAAKPADGDVAAVLTGESAISLDTGIKQARLLLIDDEERILTALKSLFRQRYHVFTTTDGNKALDFIKKYHVHVIISDQRMPIMPGVELLRRSQEISSRRAMRICSPAIPISRPSSARSTTARSTGSSANRAGQHRSADHRRRSRDDRTATRRHQDAEDRPAEKKWTPACS